MKFDERNKITFFSIYYADNNNIDDSDVMLYIEDQPNNKFKFSELEKIK